jgi:DNA repair photolyase
MVGLSTLREGEITCKTLMGRSGIGSVDYAINPYLGCAHACVYCYARFMRRMGHKGERWGSFVDAKVNALDRLRVEAPRRSMGNVLLSSVTDPYQPLERRYELTRGSLELLLERQFPETSTSSESSTPSRWVSPSRHTTIPSGEPSSPEPRRSRGGSLPSGS